jgi:hypothetical protein
MRISGNPEQISFAFRRMANTLEGYVREAEKASGQYALEEARRLSMGTYSSAMLRALGFPYSRRRPRPPQDPAIINMQSGQFLFGWRLRAPRVDGGVMRTRLVNVAPHAKFLPHGTRKMIARPFEKRIRERVETRRLRLMRAALRSWGQGT